MSPFFWLSKVIRQAISEEQVGLDIQQALRAVDSNLVLFLEEQKVREM